MSTVQPFLVVFLIGAIIEAVIFMVNETKINTLTFMSNHFSTYSLAKAKITTNAVKLAHKLGIEKTNIAFLSAVEKVNPKIQSTLDAVELVRRAEAGMEVL